jgi:phosphoribosyl 1,2-cyclic phosphodiesterase
VFLGTGTSGYVPVIPCLTDPTRSCKACQMAVQPGNRNRRRNTSGLLRYLHSDGRVRNILIDCGKSFYESSLAFFPAFGVQRIDALLLTHGHCDAMMGLDDLRQWTLGKNPIQTSVDVYLTQETMNVVKGSFPYLVNQKYATGGGNDL